MRERLDRYGRKRLGAAWVAVACALLLAAAVAPAEEEGLAPADRPGGRLHGSWLAQVDIGGWFFVQYGVGANAVTGPLNLEWILFDPTLFGSFPGAVRVTAGAGSWRSRGRGYGYTWIAYGIDGAGLPVYAIRGSGTGEVQGGNTIVFDWVLEVFPWPMNPLVDPPVTCLAGTGVKQRIPVALSTCP